MKKKDSDMKFEEAMVELEKIVADMEQGSISLDQTMRSYERGVVLLQFCRQALSEAEGKIKVYEQQTGTLQTIQVE
jgi:exodeoxyribonuclease VII small subunit